MSHGGREATNAAPSQRTEITDQVVDDGWARVTAERRRSVSRWLSTADEAVGLHWASCGPRTIISSSDPFRTDVQTV
jgi:hypothetical protein